MNAVDLVRLMQKSGQPANGVYLARAALPKDSTHYDNSNSNL